MVSHICKEKEVFKILASVDKMSTNKLIRKVINRCRGTEKDVLVILNRYVERGYLLVEDDPTHSQRKFYSIIPEHQNSNKMLESLSKDESKKIEYSKFLRPFQNKKLTKREQEKIFEYGAFQITSLLESITFLGQLSTANYYGVSVAEKSMQRLQDKISKKEHLASELKKVDSKLARAIKGFVEEGILDREFVHYK